MELRRGNEDLEKLNQSLNDPHVLKAYKQACDHHKVSFLPRILGYSLVWCGNTVYGKEPTYLKFRAVEVIARVPYHSWSCATFTLLTLFYSKEQKAIRLSDVTKYARLAQDNETMHVVVISQLAKKEERAGAIRHIFIPMMFAFFYFLWSYFLYLINPRYSYELNYMFENHAFEQYSKFLETRGEELKKKPIYSEFLSWYGRYPRNQYEFFLSVRNDEIIHRNTSIHEIQ
ncbi:hypothetical protein A2419_02850 [Candidatus Adlerbacteria bacterium RIFOXYC1_FULL_48_26]|uniref:Alternative oxidase n=1 Tax=Candidatus Adlerbacteria bacterium RIFOXYC1_FULL_48_26 TaxID=1797247 RepID=A0A1F4Y3P5_9BACT|nr:MAG: hypothetical protein A2419_02850 [Candidatus Adlerbacteria bacterium RIFOXYC1_FULL_48_26]OGC93879.1 MAG: hypothetical protein A2389_00070 [Candidatus Adlerbacteria bacterium RIFOXYB1_FULL_48_10]